MLRSFYMLTALFSALVGLSSCQFFVDGRNESLLVVSAADWSELHQFKEEQRKAKLEANKPQVLLFPISKTKSTSILVTGSELEYCEDFILSFGRLIA